jgi:hypothetical protein
MFYLFRCIDHNHISGGIGITIFFLSISRFMKFSLHLEKHYKILKTNFYSQKNMVRGNFHKRRANVTTKRRYQWSA